MAANDSHCCNCLATRLLLGAQILIERLKTKVTRQSTLDEQTLTVFPLNSHLADGSVFLGFMVPKGGDKICKGVSC